MSNLDLIKQLRAETNVSYALCKEALDNSGNDLKKAREYMRAKGAEVAEKKSSRTAAQGSIFTYIHHNTKIGAMVIVQCETDFVAKNESFKELGNNIAMQVASTAPADVDELLKSPFIKDPSLTIEQLLKDEILKMGENMSIGEFVRFEIAA